MTDSTAPAPALSFRAALPSLIVLAFVLVSNWMMKDVFSAVQESAKAELGLSDFQLSLVQGVAASIPLALAAIPLGIWIDRGNRMRLMILLAALSSIGTLLTAFAPDMWTLFVARMLASLSAAAAVIAVISIGADFCPPDKRGRAMLILTLGKWGGSAGAFIFGGLLIGLHATSMPSFFGDATPWRAVHLTLGLVSLLAIPALLLVREPARHEVAAGPGAPLRVVFDELWSRRRFLLPLFAGQIGVVAADVAAAIWAAPILSRSYGQTPDQFGSWMGLSIFIAGVVGSIVGGLAADAGHKLPRRGGILIGAVVAAALTVPTALFPLAPSVPIFAVTFTLFILGGTAAGLITAATMSVVLPNELRGLCMGIFLALSSLVGFGVAPPLVTLVSGMLGGEAYLAPGLAIVGVVVSLISFLAFILAMRRAPTKV